MSEQELVGGGTVHVCDVCDKILLSKNALGVHTYRAHGIADD